MDVTPLVDANQQIIQSYSNGQFRVSGKVYDGAVIVTPTQTLSWDVSAFENLTAADFDALNALDAMPEVVLLGAGGGMTFLDPDLRNEISGQGYSVDVMDTGAACRTYNVLVAEGRRVAALLFPA